MSESTEQVHFGDPLTRAALLTRVKMLEQALSIERGKNYDLTQDNERLRGEVAKVNAKVVPDGEYDMGDGNLYKLYAGRKLLRYENGYFCGNMLLPAGWALIRTKDGSHDEKL